MSDINDQLDQYVLNRSIFSGINRRFHIGAILVQTICFSEFLDGGNADNLQA